MDLGNALHALDLLYSEESTQKLVELSDYNWDNLVTIGQYLLHGQAWCSWTLGKLIASVFVKYGESSIEQFAKDIGISVDKAYSLRRTYLAFSNPQQRDLTLSFSHHEVAASYPNPHEVLQIASREALSVRELKQRIKKSYTPKYKPRGKACKTNKENLYMIDSTINAKNNSMDYNILGKNTDNQDYSFDFITSVHIAKSIFILFISYIFNKFNVTINELMQWIFEAYGGNIYESRTDKT